MTTIAFASSHPPEGKEEQTGINGEAVQTALLHAVSNLKQEGTGTSPPDRSTEAAAMRAARAEIEALLGQDPQEIRRHVAASMLLAERMAAVYFERAETSNGVNGRAAYAAVALRALGVAGKLAVILGATAPTPLPTGKS